MTELSEEQAALLTELEVEFKQRYTDKDRDLVQVKKAGIGPPPIVSPWQRPKERGGRDGGGRRGGHFHGGRPGSGVRPRDMQSKDRHRDDGREGDRSRNRSRSPRRDYYERNQGTDKGGSSHSSGRDRGSSSGREREEKKERHYRERSDHQNGAERPY